MKSKFFSYSVAVIFLLISAGLYAQKGIVNNGAKILVTTGGIIKISGADGNYTNKTSGSTHGRIDLDGKFKLSGYWNNLASSGNVLINVDTDGEVLLEGTANQNIQGSQTNFEKLTLNNSAGATLVTNTSVNGNFTFTAGRMTLGGYNLTLGTASTIVGTPSSSMMFLANGTGELRKLYSTTGSFTFPVGENTSTIEYSPITLNFTSGTFGASAYAGVRLVDAKHPNNSTTTAYITRYWKVVQNNISGFSCGVTGTYLAADVVGTEANMFGGRWISPNWLKLNAVNTSLDQISGTVTAFGDFSAGDQAMFCSPAITLGSTVTDVTCYGGNNGAIDLSVTNGLSPYTYLWSNSAVTQDISGLTAGTYGITVTDVNGCSATESISVIYLHDPVANAGSDGGLCPGQTTYQMSASGGSTYAWSPTTGLSNPNIYNPVANPASTTTYTLTVTDAFGCTDTDQAVVSVNTIPTAAITGTNTICAGSSTTLTASGGSTYVWSTGATTTAITVSPGTTTTYTVTATNAAGCTDTENRTVTVNPLPVAVISGTTTICAGNSTTLTASGGSTYVWSTGATTAAITISPATTTSYTVTVTSTGCTDTESATVTVNSLPTAGISGTTTICAGNSTTLTASGGTSYVWSTGATTTAITVSPGSTTTYTVTATNAAGCTDTESKIVTVNPLPTAAITGTNTICAGSSTTLTASGGSTYNWSTGATTSAITVSPATTTTYTVTATSALGCTDTENSTVTVNPLPVAVISGTTTICAGSSTTLTASGGTSFVWSTGATTAVITINPATTTTYTVTVTSTGCTDTENSTVTVNPLPTAVISGTTTICAGNSTTLTASGGTSYVWSTGATTAAITVSPATTTAYTVTVTSTGCTDTENTTVTVNPLPTAVISGTTTICAGGSTTLTASGGSSYVWSTGATTAAITISPASTTLYTVTVSSSAGCTDTENSTVTVNPLPVAVISGTTTICAGNSTTLTASGGTSYVWSTGATTAAVTVTPASTTTYTVTVTSTGCTDTENSTVTVNSLPTAVITGTTTICAGNSTTLTASGGTSYVWSTGATTAAITISPGTTTAYTVTATNAAGCTDTENSTVTVNSLPVVNAGTDQNIPNGTSTALDATVSGGSGSYTYSWDPAASLVNPTNIDPTTNILTSTVVFTLTATDQITGCFASDQMTVTVSGGPLSVTASALPTAICIGGVSQLDAVATGGSGAYTYTWASSPVGFSSSLQNPTVNPVVNTTYYVTVEDGFTDATSSIAVTVNPLPTAVISGTTTICAGSSTTLTASGGTSFNWSTGAITAAVTVSPVSTTIYTVTVTSAAGCTDTESTTVTVNPLPVAVISGTTTICAGSSTTLTASGGTGYEWSTGATTAAVTVSPGSTTAYTVTVTSTGCSDTESATVTVNSLPTAVISGTTTICAGGSTTLTASGGSSYVWSTGATTIAITVNPATTTAYTVTVTSTGCTDTESATVTVNPLPTAVISGTTTICAGNSTTLTASGGTSFVWSTGATTAAVTVSPGSTSAYTVTVTSTGCTDTESATVTVNPLPTAVITGTNSICVGGSTILTASGGASYVWSTGATTAAVTVSPGSTTSYTVTVTSTGCTDTESTTVTVNSLPTAAISGTTTICQGGSTTLTASGGTSFNWSTGASTAAITVSPGSTTTYTVTVTSATGCTDTENSTVTVNSLPTAVISGTTTICQGGSTTLTASGGTSFNWSTGASTAAINVNPVTTTTYEVTVTSSAGCTDTEDATVIVNTLPTAMITGVTTICNGNSTTLTATGGTSYEWSTGAVTSAITVSPTANTTYTVTATNAAGCEDTESVLVTVNPLPTAVISGTTTICQGVSTTLTASGGNSYTWNTGATTVDITVSPSVTTSYSVTVTTATGCTDTESASVTVNPLPLANAGTDQIICLGESATLTATGGGTYEWNTGPTNATITVSPTVTTTYTVTVTSGAGCEASDNVLVTVNPLPTANAGTDKTICLGNSTIITATGGVSYIWDNGLGAGASQTVSPIVTTTYTVTVTGSNTCTNTDQVVVNVNPLPNAFAGNDQIVCSGESVTLTATGGDNYSWDNGVDQAVPFTPVSTTIYSVTVTDSNGCTDSDAILVTVNSLPIADAGVNQTVCFGQAATLSATGGTSYLWSTSQALQTIIVNPTTTTAYYVTVTDNNSCTAVDDVTVNVNPLPVPDAGSDQIICQGDEVVLTATGGLSYAWNNGVTQGVAFYPMNTLTYTVTASDANSCTNTDQVIVTVLTTPTANAGTDQTICEGSEVVLTATGGVSYTWSGGVIQSTLFYPVTTNTYTVTVTGANGCQDTDDVTVNVNPAPPANAGVDASICDGSGAILTATGGITYYWSTTESTATINVTPVLTTTYYVTVTDDQSCTATDNVTVTVNDNPVAFAGNDQNVCSGNAVTLSATGGTSYSWSGGVNQGVSFIPVATQTYFVTVTNSFNCTATDEMTVTVFSLPDPDAGSDQVVCYGESVTLTATGGNTYAWSGGIFQSISFVPTISGDYYVTVTDLNSCTQSDTVNVTVNDLPFVDAGPDQSIPYGTSTTMAASVSGGSGIYTYSWTPADSLIIASIEDPTTLNLTTSNIFTLVVTDGTTGCTESDNMTVVVTGGPLYVDPYASNDTLCEGQSAQLFAFPGGGSGSYSFSWISNPVGFVSSDENPIVAPAVTTIYSVTIDDGSTTFTDDITIVVNPLPVADAGIDDAVCQGETMVLSATGGNSYLWSDGVTQDVGFIPTVSQTYTVTVIDLNGCSSTDDIYIAVNSLPIADAGIDQLICEGDSVVLSATGGDSYLWDNGVVQDVYFTPSGTLTYTVTVTDINSCTATDMADVTVNPVPVANAGTDIEICEGTSVVFTAMGGDIYQWSDGIIQNVPFIPTATHTYFVTVSFVTGCSSTDDITITVNPLPVADAGADQEVCYGESVTLSGAGGDTYNWSGSVVQDIAFTPVSTEVYTVTVTSTAGCSSTDNVTVTVNDLPVVDAGTDQTIPYQTSTTIDATVTGGSGSYAYDWTPADSLIDATVVDPVTIDLDGTTLFTLLVTDDVTGCTNSDDILITITGGPVHAYPSADQDTICAGESVQLEAYGSGGSGTYTYSWTSNPAGFTSTSNSTSDNPLISTYYIVTVDDGTENATDSVLVFVKPLPVVDLGPDTVLCPDDTLILDAGAGYDSYLWSTGDVTQTIEIDSADIGIATMTISVTVFENGCENTDFVDVTYDICSDIHPDIQSELAISIYPNPTNGKVYTRFEGLNETVTISVMDVNSKLIYQQVINGKQEAFTNEIDLSELAEGVYMIKFIGKTFTQIERIVLTK